MNFMKSCSVLVQNNQFIFKVKDEPPFVLWFGGFKSKHYRPFYQYIEDEKPGEVLPLALSPQNSEGEKINVLMCDDALQMDFRKIRNFLKDKLGYEQVNMTYQSLYLSRTVKKYVALTKTCRCIVIKYIKNGRLIGDSYLPLSLEKEEIKEEIKQLHKDILSEKLPIFIIDMQEDIKEIEDLGVLIHSSQILENYEYMQVEK